MATLGHEQPSRTTHEIVERRGDAEPFRYAGDPEVGSSRQHNPQVRFPFKDFFSPTVLLPCLLFSM